MYGAFAISAFQTRLAYRGQVWAQLFGELVRIFAKVSIWMSVYGAAASFDGVTLREMVTYAVLAGVLTLAWEWDRLLTTIGTQIKTGDVAVFLLKPLNYLVMLFAGECGNLGFKIVAIVLPVTVLAGAAYGLEPPASVFHGVMFIAFWALGFVILFLLAAVFGLLAFWLMTTFSLEWLLSAFLALLSGQFVPLWFFPKGFAEVLALLPFSWVAYHPLEVYLGKIGPGATLLYLLLGVGWALVLGLAAQLLWRRAARRIVVQGG